MEEKSDDDTAELDTRFRRDRDANDQKLKTRFEHIFRKYEKDFTGIGDEIDLETGQIIINNGHLESMRHEVDTGRSNSSQLARVLAEDLDKESVDEESESEDLTPDDIENGDVSDEPHSFPGSETSSNSGYTSSGILTDQEDDECSRSRLDELSSNADSRPGPSSDQEALLSPVAEAGSVTAEISSHSNRPSHTQALSDLPAALRGSMLALRGPGTKFDEGSLDKLGKSIATQIAQFLATSGASRSSRLSCPHGGREDAWAFPELPARKRQRTKSPISRHVLSSSAALFTKSPGAADSIWAPIDPPRRYTRQTPEPVIEARAEANAGSNQEREPQATDTDLGETQQHDDSQHSAHAEDQSLATKAYECVHCRTLQSRKWRNTDLGKMCSSCAMYYYRYGITKPLMTDQSFYPANTARPIKRTQAQFSLEDDALIIKLRELQRQSWDSIGRQVNGYSGYVVQKRYMLHLEARQSLARDMLVSEGFLVQPILADCAVGEEEEKTGDEQVDNLRQATGLPWEKLTRSSPRRALHDLQKRYVRDLAQQRLQTNDSRANQHAMSPIIDDFKFDRFTHFEPAEDKLICSLRETAGLRWDEMVQYLPKRNQTSIVNRYRYLKKHGMLQSTRRSESPGNARQAGPTAETVDIARSPKNTYPDPSAVITQGLDSASAVMTEIPVNDSSLAVFTVMDDRLIKRLREQEGMLFADIAEKFPGRDATVISDRYHSNIVGKKLPPWTSTSRQWVAERPYKEKEMNIILKCRVRGLEWHEIASRLDGRTGSSVKTQYELCQNNRMAARAQRSTTSPVSQHGQPHARCTPLPNNSGDSTDHEWDTLPDETGGISNDMQDPNLVETHVETAQEPGEALPRASPSSSDCHGSEQKSSNTTSESPSRRTVTERSQQSNERVASSLDDNCPAHISSVSSEPIPTPERPGSLPASDITCSDEQATCTTVVQPPMLIETSLPSAMRTPTPESSPLPVDVYGTPARWNEHAMPYWVAQSTVAAPAEGSQAFRPPSSSEDVSQCLQVRGKEKHRGSSSSLQRRRADYVLDSESEEILDSNTDDADLPKRWSSLSDQNSAPQQASSQSSDGAPAKTTSSDKADVVAKRSRSTREASQNDIVQTNEKSPDVNVPCDSLTRRSVGSLARPPVSRSPSSSGSSSRLHAAGVSANVQSATSKVGSVHTVKRPVSSSGSARLADSTVRNKSSLSVGHPLRRVVARGGPRDQSVANDDDSADELA